MNTTRRPRGLLLAIALTALLLTAAPQAGAQEEGSATGTVTVAIRSITVSPDTFEFGNCTLDGESTGDALAFPNGTCRFDSVVLTNGEAPATIHYRATDFEGSNGGTPWSHDRSSQGPPGPDEADLLASTRFGLPSGTSGVATSDTCDVGWEFGETGDFGCSAAPGQVSEREMVLIGPESTTNTSPSFSTTITWTALP